MKATEILFQCQTDDAGDVTYQVTSRQGSAGEMPPQYVLHRGPAREAALKVLQRAARAAARGQMEKITTAEQVKP